MDCQPPSAAIARELATVWDYYREKSFNRYLAKTFGAGDSAEPEFRCFYIGETEEGDLTNGPTGALVKHWWIVDDDGVRDIMVPRMDWTQTPYFSTPKILFYVDDARVAVVEIYGPRKRFWKRGIITQADSQVRIASIEVLEMPR